MDDYAEIKPEAIQWGNLNHRMSAVGRGTLVTKRALPGGGFTLVIFPRTLCMPNFGINLLSVKQLSRTIAGSGVLFRAGATLLDANNQIMGYAPEPKARSKMYPFVCSIVSGDVGRQEALTDARTVEEFLALNSLLNSRRITFLVRELPPIELKNDNCDE